MRGGLKLGVIVLVGILVGLMMGPYRRPLAPVEQLTFQIEIEGVEHKRLGAPLSVATSRETAWADVVLPEASLARLYREARCEGGRCETPLCAGYDSDEAEWACFRETVLHPLEEGIDQASAEDRPRLERAYDALTEAIANPDSWVALVAAPRAAPAAGAGARLGRR